MGRDFRISVTHFSAPNSPFPAPEPVIRRPIITDLPSPLGNIKGLERDELREAAYEVFFTACRSSPGFGGRSALTYYNAADSGDPSPGSPGKHSGIGMAVTSRVKRALGLKMLKKTPPSRRTNSCGAVPMPSSPSSSSPSSPRFGFAAPHKARFRRPLTSAEIMRLQMKVTEQSDNRLRKTLMRTLVGQMGRRAETIILPLELLRHLKPSEFNDADEYHMWQRRQLKILEAGLLLHPSIPLDKHDAFAVKLRETIGSSDERPLDTGKNSITMRALCNCVVSLAWRSPDGGSTEVCHWADGYPLNVHIYTALLASIFDLKEETMVLDEVDELMELIKKTWSTLGINRSVHNVCFTWVLFEQFVVTGQVESDLLGASFAMMTEVASDAKKSDRDTNYLRILAKILTAMKKWMETRLLNYHANFNRETVGIMENMLPLLFSATKILEEDVPASFAAEQEKGENGDESSGNRADHYIRTSLRTAFAKMVEDQGAAGVLTGESTQEASELLIKLAKKTEELALKEKDTFSPLLKKWHPVAAGVAAVTLHTCYGTLMKQFLAGKPPLLSESALVLQRAGKLEKNLVQLVVEDSVECDDGGMAIVREMTPYEVDSIIVKQMKQWIQERLQKGKELVSSAKRTETWNPMSKSEPHAHSAGEIVTFAREAIDNFFDIPIPITESSFNYLVEGLQTIFKEYIAFVGTCGSKQSYTPTLPPLTRCSGDSKILKLWKKAACSVGVEDLNQILVGDSNHPRSTTSRGTQRLYIRLNTLYYLVTQLQAIDKMVSISPKILANKTLISKKKPSSSSYFDSSLSILQLACQHLSEVAAYRLVFLDCNSVLYGKLYVGGVPNSRINPALRVLKQNITLLCAMVTERAQPTALKEVMKACFEAFLMVLLAGGSSRMFSKMDHPLIEEDFELLKRLFCSCGEGFIVEDVVERESEVVQGVVALMKNSTEQLVEDFSSVASETSGVGGMGSGQKIPMPPTTGKWNRSDPNTILRVLCARKDRAANHFLKKTFRLAKKGTGIRLI